MIVALEGAEAGMDQEPRPKLSLEEPWWRSWVWEGLPNLCAFLGFLICGVAGFFTLWLLYWLQDLEPGRGNKLIMCGLVAAAAAGGYYGRKAGEAAVKRLRGRSGQGPSVGPSQPNENSPSEPLVSNGTDSIQPGNP